MKVKLDLSNYVTKTNLKEATGIDLIRIDSTILKIQLDKIDIDKVKILMLIYYAR